MGKLINVFVSAVCLFGTAQTIVAQNQVTITGNVKFTEPNFKMTLYQRQGFDKITLGEATVNPDNSYTLTVDVKEPGEATLDCGHWQSVRVWLENENLDINFRGVDTAKIKIKNPPYVYINGGKNNALMNLINFDSYRSYQAMIAISQAAYRGEFVSDKAKQALTSNLYDFYNDNYTAYMRYYAEHYTDCNSVMVALGALNYQANKELIDASLAKLEKQGPTSAKLVAQFRQAEADKQARLDRMKIGNPAPHFTCLSPDGKKISPADYKGKVLVLDFWASWCGPCRAETPNLKKYYDEFKGQNVEFLSVSIDENKDAWLKAMKEDGATWPQGRTEDVGKEVMDLYQFSGIPFILVIDANGNIYRKNVRGENIREAVKDALEGKPAVEPKQGKTISMGAAMM